MQSLKTLSTNRPSASLFSHSLQIVREVRSRKTDCYALLAYSQGAVAAITALPQLEDQFDSIKAIALIGDPHRQPDLPCNVDSHGGKSTSGAKGIGSARGGIGQKWIEKTLDICAKVSCLAC